ncbi:hypothetical protein HPB51_008160 [Rhipicephalus microplus]|uniref:Endonuclease/exonuclease/phosphatase domain-containing protein n=1 Tax=Rhipicephalus microplus TaxID=6941 RepID=A0A9J6D4H8_RHIMP|nr:hypothetical protein HPB51_008160 [Rhipicephalus microplus]
MVQYKKTISKNKLPDVIALQEPFGRAQLPGCVTCAPPCECTGKDIKMCTLVKTGSAFIDHAPNVSEDSDTERTLVEVVSDSGTRKNGLFVSNVYSAPSKRGLKHNFSTLSREAMAKVTSSLLLICDAPHTQWEYGTNSTKGKRLAALIDELSLVVLNELASHARIGQGACRDTSLDLSIWSEAGAIAWSNFFGDLGSDHSPVPDCGRGQK